MNRATINSCCGAEHGLISVDEALHLISQHAAPLNRLSIPLVDALGHYLAEDIYSSIDLPLFSQSAVDGYAICYEQPLDISSQFKLIGEIKAGQMSAQVLQAGEAIRIFTGAPIPNNTISVARQEIVTVDNNLLYLTQPLKNHADIRNQGEEIAIGQLLAQKKQQLHVGAIASLSMAGVKRVAVYPHPKVAAVITGDEVADSTEHVDFGKIFDANTPLLTAWSQQQNKRLDTFFAKDNEQEVHQLLTHLSQYYDVIITTGGVSVGDYDFIRPVALNIGFSEIFWKVKQKPGKPLFFSHYQRKDGSTCYLLGLPGNPASVYVGLHIYADRLLKALQGSPAGTEWFTGVVSDHIKHDLRERFLRMSATFEQGTLKLASLPKQQSHMLSNLMHANCLVRIPANKTIQKGEILQGIFI